MQDNIDTTGAGTTRRTPWNKGRLVGQKPPLKLKDLWGIRLRLQLAERVRDLALFNLAVDSKLRGCDLVRLRVADVAHGEHVLARTTVLQQKTGRPVRFELTGPIREAIQARLAPSSGWRSTTPWRSPSKRRYEGVRVWGGAGAFAAPPVFAGSAGTVKPADRWPPGNDPYRPGPCRPGYPPGTAASSDCGHSGPGTRPETPARFGGPVPLSSVSGILTPLEGPPRSATAGPDPMLHLGGRRV